MPQGFAECLPGGVAAGFPAPSATAEQAGELRRFALRLVQPTPGRLRVPHGIDGPDTGIEAGAKAS